MLDKVGRSSAFKRAFITLIVSVYRRFDRRKK